MYQKEVALAAIPLIAAALFVARGRLAPLDGPLARRRYALAAIGAVVVLPLVHVAIQAIRITLRGDLVYGAEVDGGEGIRRGLEILYDWASEAMPQSARDLMFVTVALVVVASVVRRRVDVLALGALASGLLTIVFAAQSGVAVSRYYIPLLALFVVAASLSLARLPDLIAAAGVLVVFFAFMPPTETRAQVRQWTDEEQQHVEIVRLVAELERSGCVVAADGLDLETSLALPQLTSLDACCTRAGVQRSAYLVLPPYGAETFALRKTCRAGGLEPVLVGRLLGVFACTRVAAGAEGVLAAHRFRSSTDVACRGVIVGGRVVAVDRLGDEVERAILDLVEDPPHVLPDDPEAQQLDTSEEEHDDDDGRPARDGRVGEEADVESPRQRHEAERHGEEPEGSDQADRRGGERRHRVSREVQHATHRILRLARMTRVAGVRDGRLLEADPAAHAAQVARTFGHREECVQRAAGEKPEVTCLLRDVDRAHAVDELVEGRRGCELEPRLALAVLADREDDVRARLPTLDELRDELRRILQVSVHRDHDVAARVLEPCAQRDLMAEVA